ncbi:hypothetical protein CEXT_561621 [Caerostris extrusa]|uniref:Uncharacterized protein n=1 Tax=Caerostris extrusa TaxID=172846 RepID=A0AAV4WPE4_CAEEX|nr:hypothetical protein CEXT_561621 [Caerostris extrusa]
MSYGDGAILLCVVKIPSFPTCRNATSYRICSFFFLQWRKKQSVFLLDASQSEESSLLYKEPFVKKEESWNSLNERGLKRTGCKVMKQTSAMHRSSHIHANRIKGML